MTASQRYHQNELDDRRNAWLNSTPKTMIVTLKSTTKIVELNGVPARVWEGMTASGIEVHAFITRVAIDEQETRREEFEAELEQQSAPTPGIQAYDFRLIL